MSRHNLELTINTTALAQNMAIMRAHIGPMPHLAAVVKADGYGLGIGVVVQVLDRAGADAFYVANLDEGIRARVHTTKPIMVFSGVTDTDDCALYRDHALTPVINAPGQLQIWQHTMPDLAAVLHLDTGMNRLGFSADETSALVNDPGLVKRLALTDVISHFACSDEANHPMNEAQYTDFVGRIAALRAAGARPFRATLANSSGIFRAPRYHLDGVRPGLGLYGGNPTPERANPMHPVVGLRARALQVRTTRAGETVGYSATHRFDHPTTLVTLGCGYADGLIRGLSNRGTVYWAGQPCPVVGRVSMDLISVAVPVGVPPPALGDWLELIGPNQSLDTLAATAGTIGYEFLTQLSHRALRKIVS
jgi:alanine racemase